MRCSACVQSCPTGVLSFGQLAPNGLISIDSLDWMTPSTKLQAQIKLSKVATKIGYPQAWRDYSGLWVSEVDAMGNALRSARFEWMRMAAQVGLPVDRQAWPMNPQTVNACYDPSRNEIVFPAAILQPPFFDMAADDAVNYGAIGAVIGHEISHRRRTCCPGRRSHG